MPSSGLPPEVPNFGKLLAKFIGSVPEASRPRFLARLERGAADRYRRWAAELPEHAEALLACAASEEQIAIRVEALYPVVPAHLAAIEAALPKAVEAYLAVFEGHTVEVQLAIQAAAERQGSEAWQGLKVPGLPSAHAAALDVLTALEVASAERVEMLVKQLKSR